MKTHIVILACLCGALTYALPVSNSEQENIDLVQIPLNGDKELDILTLGETGQLSERNKRTIGILRQLFPELTKQVEDKVNQVVGQLIRSIGPSILRTAVGGNGRSNSRTSFDSDFTDDDDGETSDTPSGTRVQIELPNFDDDDDDNNTASNDTADSADSASSGSSTTEPSFVFMKQEEVANSDSDILSINLNSDLITRTDSTPTDNSETSDDATNDNAGDNTNNDSSNNDDSNSDNGDSTADTPNTDAGNDGSSDSAADAAESTTISDESNII